MLKSGVSGLVQKVAGSGKDLAELEICVHSKFLEENSKTFFEQIRSNKNCFKLNKILLLDFEFVAAVQGPMLYNFFCP